MGDQEVVNEFMGLDEIAFIISKDITNEKRVLIIGSALIDPIKQISEQNKSNPIKSKIIKFKKDPVPCQIISDGLPMDDEKYIESIELNVNIDELLADDGMKLSTYILTTTSDNKLTFGKKDEDATGCNTSVTVHNGQVYYASEKAGEDNKKQITNPIKITANEGLLIIPSLEGGKPRRKRNKASMKKYKKRKSSTGKKKKIPRRRSRKLRRRK